LDETLARFDAEVVKYCAPFESAVELLDTIPGVARRSAESIVGEIVTDMSRFPTAAHLAVCAGVASGNYESAGKHYRGKTRQGNAALRTSLVQAANAAAQTTTYLGAQYHCIARRRGRQRAIIAVAHSILVIAYHLIARQESYRDLGANYFDSSRPEATTKRLAKSLEQLGHQVTLQSQSPPTVVA